MTKPIPSELNEILQSLPTNWTLSSLEFWNIGWVADLSVKSRKFQLVSDRGYIDVYELIDGKKQPILPPEEQRLSITPSQVLVLLTENAI